MVLVKKEKETVKEVLRKAIEMQVVARPSHLNLNEIKITTKNSLLAKIKNDSEKLLFLYKLLKGKPDFLNH